MVTWKSRGDAGVWEASQMSKKEPEADSGSF
jgi:hypothetical protein